MVGVLPRLVHILTNIKSGLELDQIAALGDR